MVKFKIAKCVLKRMISAWVIVFCNVPYIIHIWHGLMGSYNTACPFYVGIYRLIYRRSIPPSHEVKEQIINNYSMMVQCKK